MLLYEQYSRRGIWGAHVSGIWGLSTCESGGLGALSDERGSGPLSLRELGGIPEDGVEVNVGACESNYDEGVRFGQLMMRENFELPSADSPLEAPFGWIEKKQEHGKREKLLNLEKGEVCNENQN